MSNYLMQILETKGVPTHFVEELSNRETAVKRVTIVPLEVIIRNRAAGSICKRLGLEEGMDFVAPSIEFSYKCVMSWMIRLFLNIMRFPAASQQEKKWIQSRKWHSRLMMCLKNILHQSVWNLLTLSRFGKTSGRHNCSC